MKLTLEHLSCLTKDAAYPDDVIRRAGMQNAQRAADEKRKAASKPQTDRLMQSYEMWRRNPTPANMRVVLQAAENVISAGMISYAGGDNPVLRPRAQKLAANAVRTFNPQSDASLKSWMSIQLQGLRRYAGELSPIKVPELVRLDQVTINKAINEFKNENGREPSDVEISDITGIPRKRLNHVRSLQIPVVNEGAFTPDESQGDDSDVYIPGLPNDSRDNIWAEYVYHDLDDEGKTIFDMSLGRGKWKGQQPGVVEMAKAIGKSPGYISQKRRSISSKLVEGLNMDSI